MPSVSSVVGWRGMGTQSQAKGIKQSKTSKAAKATKASQTTAKATEPALFTPITLRGMTARNRVWLPPMDMYSAFARDGRPTDFHYQHYVSRALGGFGLIIVEATAVTPDGRISPCDLGLWEDAQIDAYRWITEAVKQAGAVPAIQLNHAGRKGSIGCFSIGYDGQTVPADKGGWPTVGPSDLAFGGLQAPRALDVDDIHGIVHRFRDAAWRAMTAGFEAVEIHAAHGYLLSEFLDPLINTRTDDYGGSLANRMRMLVEVVDEVRGVIRDDLPLFVRISATDWAEGGWDVDQSVVLARTLKEHGVDLIDVSPGYQVPFADRIRAKAGVPTTAVGLITKPKQAQKIVAHGQADAVEIGRAALRDPYWPLRAAAKLGVGRAQIPYPPQYLRGAW